MPEAGVVDVFVEPRGQEVEPEGVVVALRRREGELEGAEVNHGPGEDPEQRPDPRVATLADAHRARHDARQRQRGHEWADDGAWEREATGELNDVAREERRARRERGENDERQRVECPAGVIPLAVWRTVHARRPVWSAPRVTGRDRIRHRSRETTAKG
jgi:hypothetical protein